MIFLKITKEEAHAQGREAAVEALRKDSTAGDIWMQIENNIKFAKVSYPGVEGIDLQKEALKFSKERMESDLDLTQFPECRGLREVVEAERRGFAEVIDDPYALAFHFDWAWFCSRRLNPRFVGKIPLQSNCTDFWFADTKEGGPIHGDNRDDALFMYEKGSGFDPPPTTGPKETHFTKVTGVGGVSSAVLCDEEPDNLFPVNMAWITPDITDLKEFIAFMERYREFWGPANYLFVDPDMNFAAVEKANIRMGVRYQQF